MGVVVGVCRHARGVKVSGTNHSDRATLSRQGGSVGHACDQNSRPKTMLQFPWSRRLKFWRTPPRIEDVKAPPWRPDSEYTPPGALRRHQPPNHPIGVPETMLVNI